MPEVQDKIRVLSVLVEDGQNTLTKVSGVIRRRGFHVRGISVGPSRQPGRVRITLQVDHGHAEADQVRKQLERLVEVIEVDDVTGGDVHSRELVVAKVETKAVEALVKRGAKVLSRHNGTTTVARLSVFGARRRSLAPVVYVPAPRGVPPSRLPARSGMVV